MTDYKSLFNTSSRVIRRRGKKESDSDRVARYNGILDSIHNTLFHWAKGLQRDLPEFHQSLVDNTQNHPVLVELAMQELLRQHGSIQEWKQYCSELEEEVSKLVSKMDWDAVAIQNYHREVSDNRQRGSNRIRALEFENQELRRSLTTFENAGHQHLIERSALEEKHRKEIQRLREQNQEKIEGVNQAHGLEKIKLQQEIEKSVRKSLYSELDILKEQHKTDFRTAQSVHNREVEKLEDKLATIDRKHKGEKDKLKDGFKKELAELERKLKDMDRTQQVELQRKQREYADTVRITAQTHATEIRKAQQDYQIAQNHWEQAKSQIKREHNFEINKVRKDHENDTNALNKEHLDVCISLKKQMEDMENDHEKVIDGIKNDHQNQIQMLNDRIERMGEDHRKEIDGLKDAHLNERKSLNDQITNLETDHAKEIKRLNDEFREEKENIAQQTTDNITRLTDEYQKKVASLKKKHAAETQQIKKDRNAYSAALLARDKARDNFDELSDVEIKAKFQGVKQEVEKLAALEWRSDQTQKINRLSPTPTVLMRQILQDTIWVILYEYIFGSPFRIFGNEGTMLEKKWFEECESGLKLYQKCIKHSENLDFINHDYLLISAGTAVSNGRYIWPKPEVETERWRYTTIQEGRDALRKPVSEYDNRAKLKKGFLAASEELRTQLESTLSEVVDLNKSNIQTIKDLTRKASTVWLEMGMQRFRIIVVIQDSGLDSIRQRITRAQEGSLELVLVPELKSFGDSKGGDLDEEQTIRGCEGEIFQYKGPQRRG